MRIVFDSPATPSVANVDVVAAGGQIDAGLYSLSRCCMQPVVLLLEASACITASAVIAALPVCVVDKQRFTPLAVLLLPVVLL